MIFFLFYFIIRFPTFKSYISYIGVLDFVFSTIKKPTFQWIKDLIKYFKKNFYYKHATLLKNVSTNTVIYQVYFRKYHYVLLR